MITAPTIVVINRSVTTPEAEDWLARLSPDVTDGDHTAEYAARRCYRANKRLNPATEANDDYLEHILEVGHFSVLAHAGAALDLSGISRSCAMELIRSRFPGFSMESQRYVPSGDLDWVCPPLFLDDPESQAELEEGFRAEIARYERLAARWEAKLEAEQPELGRRSRVKMAREAARAAVPNDAETSLVMSANYRAWRDFFLQRCSPDADKEIARLAYDILDVLRPFAPNTFQDLPGRPA